MAQIDYPASIKQLILLMKTLPGLGPRSAERLVLWLMGRGKGRVNELVQALQSLQERVAVCGRCGFFLERDHECALCDNPKRNQHLLCVVEEAADILRLERSGAYQGLYHVLGGKLSPLDNVTPSDLRIDELIHRVDGLNVEEVILALGSDVEGEATANYIAGLLGSSGPTVTRLAQGMPAGGGLDHVDELTLFQALSGRRKVGT